MIKLPSKVNIKELINDLRVVSWEVSDTLLYYAQLIQNSKNTINILKNDDIDNPVTSADLKVNEIIIKKISEKYKGVDWEILSEENVKLKNHNFQNNNDWIWILDPLDGTKDFLQGTSNYAMHLALNYKQKPYLGVVLIPAREELWIAYEEKVWCEKKNGFKVIPNSFKEKKLNEMTLVTSKNHRNQTLKNLIKKVNFKEVIVMGSIGCKITSIVNGKSDIYICLSLPGESSPKDWDFAAPAAVLRSSGGVITNIYNQELTYGKSNFGQEGIIIASNNSKKHGQICLEIREIIEKYNLYPFYSS